MKTASFATNRANLLMGDGKMKAAVLIDNLTYDVAQKQLLADTMATKTGLIAEWGLSIYIEYNGHRILLDAGTTGAFAGNAKILGVDLSKVELGVLSHAHYDHADGMDTFFEVNKNASCYLRAGSDSAKMKNCSMYTAMENCYDYDKEHPEAVRYIGIKQGMLETYANRIRFAVGDMEVLPGVYLTPHKTENLDKIGEKAHMYVKKDGTYIPDDYSHEQSLVFETEKGLVIFNSCSHGGADNIIREIEQTFPDKKMYAIIGGFHLYKSSEEEVRALARRIKATGIEKVVTGHCTGEVAYKILEEELGDCLEQIYTGLVMEF